MSSQGLTLTRKFLQFLFRVLPVRIFTAALLLLILFTQRSSNGFFKLLGVACSGNIGLIVLPFTSLLMIAEDSERRIPLLIIIIVLELVFIRLRIHTLDRKDRIATLSDRDQKGRKIEIRNDFGEAFIAAIEIIPHSIYSPDGEPVTG